jgi:hypothetical protein
MCQAKQVLIYHKWIHYLGHIILEEGIIVDPKKIKEMRE